MRSNQTEAWALRLIEAARAGQPCEDSRAELKAKWPDDFHRAARRIAGHANAAGGEPILRLIGVDEASGTVPGVDQNAFADWWAQVSKQFDSLAPCPHELTIPYNGATVFALQFDTDRAPFLVRNPAFGVQQGAHVAWELPWRDGTKVRSATRADVLRMLTPERLRPEVELLEAWLKYADQPRGNVATWELVLSLYIIPRSEEPLVFPFHRCEAEVRGPFGYEFSMNHVVIGGRQSVASGDRGISFATSPSQTELVLTTPRQVYLTALQDTPRIGGTVGLPADITVRLRMAGTDQPISVTTTLPYQSTDDEGGRWALDAIQPRLSDLRLMGRSRSPR